MAAGTTRDDEPTGMEPEEDANEGRRRDHDLAVDDGGGAETCRSFGAGEGGAASVNYIRICNGLCPSAPAFA